MDVLDWVDSLDRLTAADGWIGKNDENAEFARKVLDDYGQRKAWIGHEFPAIWDNRNKPSEEVEPAIKQREAMLCLAVARGLLERSRRLGEAAQDLERLAADLVEAAKSSPTGLRAAAADGQPGPYQKVDFAHSEVAREFFEQNVRLTLARLDDAHKTDLATYVGESYDRGAEGAIERWGRAWTATCALVLPDWATARGCKSDGEFVRLLWVPSKKLYVKAPPLPTDEKLHFELRTWADHALIFEGRDELWDAPCDEVVPIRVAMNELNYTSVGGEVTYHGRNVRQLYLLLLADCLRAANRSGSAAEKS